MRSGGSSEFLANSEIMTRPTVRDDQTNNKKGGGDVKVDQTCRHPPGLHIAVFHRESGVITSPGITRDGTSRPTVTPGKHLLGVSILIKFCWTPRLESVFIQNFMS